MKISASSSPSGASLLIAVLATAVFGLTTLWYFKSNSNTRNTLGLSIAQLPPTATPAYYRPTPTIPTLRLYLGQRGKVVCNRGMVVASRVRENPQDLYVTCRIPSPTPTIHINPSCRPWPTCTPDTICPQYYPPQDGWCPPYYNTPTPRPTTVYPTARPTCISLDCPQPADGCYYKGWDGCTTCGQLICPTSSPTRSYWQNAQ